MRNILKAVGLSAIGLAAMQSSAAHAAWTAEANFPAALRNLTTCAIANNRTLVVGGDSAAGTPSIAWAVYDETGAIVDQDTGGDPNDNFPAARAEGRLIKKDSDDKCYYFGGRSDSGATPEQEVFEYDLSAGTWTDVTAAGTQLDTARYAFEVMSVGTDLWLAIGGKTASNTYTSSIEIINLTGGGITTNPLKQPGGMANYALLAAKAYFQFARVDADTLIIAGGRNSGGRLASVEKIDYAASIGTQTTLDNMNVPTGCTVRSNGVMIPVSIAASNADFLVTGGETDSGALLTTCLLDIGAGAGSQWSYSSTRNLPVAATNIKAVLLSANDYVLVGGADAEVGDSANSIKASYQWVDANDAFTVLSNLSTARDLTALAVMNATVFAFGGQTQVVGSTTVATDSVESQ